MVESYGQHSQACSAAGAIKAVDGSVQPNGISRCRRVDKSVQENGWRRLDRDLCRVLLHLRSVWRRPPPCVSCPGAGDKACELRGATCPVLGRPGTRDDSTCTATEVSVAGIRHPAPSAPRSAASPHGGWLGAGVQGTLSTALYALNLYLDSQWLRRLPLRHCRRQFRHCRHFA
jgi:hypothetical protein